ncbi:MAG: flagellar assembly protein FliX [Rickettsiales bacterium]
MKIETYNNLKNIDKSKKRAGAGKSSSFSNMLDISENSDTIKTSSTANIAPSQQISGILSLQELSDEEINRQKSVKYGNDLLDTLEQLRKRLLIGTMSMDTLRNIKTQLSKQKQNVMDPHLLSIIDDIDLRAAVELAKLEVATKTNK